MLEVVYFLPIVGRMNLTKSQLMTEISKAEKVAAKTAHAASMAKDSNAKLNADAVAAERHLAKVRNALWNVSSIA